MKRIGQLYDIEREVRGCGPEERKQVRQARARPILEAMHTWLKVSCSQLSRKSDVAQAIHYALSRWTALTRYCGDGHIEIGRVEMWRGGLGWAYLFPAFRYPVPH